MGAFQRPRLCCQSRFANWAQVQKTPAHARHGLVEGDLVRAVLARDVLRGLRQLRLVRNEVRVELDAELRHPVPGDLGKSVRDFA